VTRYRLLPRLRVGRLGARGYFFDLHAHREPLLHVPTREVSRRVFRVAERLLDSEQEGCPRTLAELRALFDDREDRDAVDLLLRRGYLEACAPAPATAEAPAAPPSLDALRPAAMAAFDATGRAHFLAEPRLFGVPDGIPDAEVQVGFAGLPFASVADSRGCTAAPAYLRDLSLELGSWFQVHRLGVYSDLGAAGRLPPVLCRGVMLKDYGDVGAGARTVGELFERVRAFVDETLIPNGIRALFAGGDHAVTFPVVDALFRHHPDLCLVHLDAHNDLFYCDAVAFNHAGPISSLLMYTGVTDVWSLGVRTQADLRTDNVARLAAEPEAAARVHSHPIGAVKRLLADPEQLDGLLAAIGRERPCYLTIDVDVLSASALANRTSTPAGAGLEWWELFALVDAFFAGLDVIGADVVELNPARADRPDESRTAPAALLLRLIHGLAGGKVV